MKKQVISFPHMGDYHVPIRGLLQNLFPHFEIRPAPPITKKTSTIGARFSPEFICEPFKYNLGNYIEALENGATILLQTGTGCRYGYYSKLQEEILKNLGYEFTFLHLSRKNAYPLAAYKMLKSAGMQCGFFKAGLTALKTMQCISIMDKYADILRKHQWYLEKESTHRLFYHTLLQELENIETQKDIFHLGRQYRKMKAQGTTTKQAPIKVGIIGDLYTVMEPFANKGVEAFLSNRNIEIHRKMSVRFLLSPKIRGNIARKSKGYLQQHIGANATDSIIQSLNYAKEGLDGIIQLKAFGCTPELNASPILQKISADFDIPILQLSFDTHQSTVGLETRLEAFCDILEMRKVTKDEKETKPWHRHRFHFHKSRPTG